MYLPSRSIFWLIVACGMFVTALDAPAQSSSTPLASSSPKKKKPQRALKWPYRFTIPMSSHLETAPKRGDKSEQLIYETENFIFYSPVHLQRKARERLARIFECGLEANMVLSQLLPIRRMEQRREIIEKEEDAQASLPKGEVFESERPKLKTYLFKTMEDYYAAGASPGSAGVYRFGFSHKNDVSGLVRDEILVPLPSMGILPNGKVEDRSVDSHVLVHELTHQCTALNFIPIWINEGLSEYVGYISTKSYSLNFSTSPKGVQNEVKRVAPKGVNYPFSLKDFFTMSQASFSSNMGNGVNTYLLAAVVTTYFMDLAGKKGQQKLIAYLEALNKAMPKNEPPNVDKFVKSEEHEEILKLLLDDKLETFEDLEKDVIKRAKKLKLKLEFAGE